MNNNIFDPLFTTAVLVPKHLDFTLSEWQCLPPTDFIVRTEELRKYIVDIVLGSGHNFFTGNLTLNEINEKFQKLKNFDGTTFIQKPKFTNVLDLLFKDSNGIITYNGQLTCAVNHWFPEIAYARNRNGIAIVDQFYDGAQFYKNFEALIKKDRFKFVETHGTKNLSQKLKEGLRLVNGNQPMQNFPAGIAKFIINHSLKRNIENNEFNILDPCAGWGGRLVGALAAFSNEKYNNKIFNFFTTEVNSSIYNRYTMLVNYWNINIQTLKNFNLIMPSKPIPFEEILNDKIMEGKEGTFDIALTSPPYYDCEKYSYDLDQSYLKFKTYSEWKIGFLYPLLKNTFILLKQGGEFYLNISNLIGKEGIIEYNLEEDTKNIANQIGYDFYKKYLIEMPTHANFTKDFSHNEKIRIRDGKRHKYEPIFVFVKP